MHKLHYYFSEPKSLQVENSNNEILDINAENNGLTRRRKLLPWWIKIFIWLFLFFGLVIPFGLLASSLFNLEYQVEIYGIKSYEAFSMMGVLLTIIYLLKGVTAFALWTEKNWAITIGRIDAIIGIIICVYMSVVYPFIDATPGFNFTFRLELVLLIPFLIKLDRISKNWIQL